MVYHKTLSEGRERFFYILSVDFYQNWHLFPPVVRQNVPNGTMIRFKYQAVYVSNPSAGMMSTNIAYSIDILNMVNIIFGYNINIS